MLPSIMVEGTGPGPEQADPASPLFTVRFVVPGAEEARSNVLDREKKAEIEARMSEKAAERAAKDAARIAKASAEIGEAEGDGSPNRDNGVRIDVAFRARLPLPEEKLRWTRSLSLQSEAYDTEHPSGF